MAKKRKIYFPSSSKKGYSKKKMSDFQIERMSNSNPRPKYYVSKPKKYNKKQFFDLTGTKNKKAYKSYKKSSNNPFGKAKNLKVNNRKNPASSLNPQRSYKSKIAITKQKKYKKKPNFKF